MEGVLWAPIRDACRRLRDHHRSARRIRDRVGPIAGFGEVGKRVSPGKTPRIGLVEAKRADEFAIDGLSIAGLLPIGLTELCPGFVQRCGDFGR